MRIHAYTLCYNEQTLMPYFLRHYASFADEITIFDNESNDNTLSIIEDFKSKCDIPINVVTYKSDNQVNDSKYIQLKNMTLKLSKGKDDWIFVLDTDELIYHPHIREYLEQLSEYDVIHPKAYHMIGKELPTTDGQIYEEANNGVFDSYHSKPCILNTHRLNNISFDAGAHHLQSNATRILNWDSNEIKLLHYKWLSLQYVINNYKRNASRLSDENKRHGWGFHYMWQEDKIRQEYDQMLQNAKGVI